jgi:alpha/beta superfamily hydrolase
MSKAPVKQSITIAGPAGALEALLETPSDAQAGRVAILCHPHPQHQGTMLNKVVHTLARACNDLHMPALRFNFRGVEASEGAYAGGDGEIDDVLAVAAYAHERWPGAGIVLAGFSFGGVVAARAAAELAPLCLVSIAPAVNILGARLAEVPSVPWLIVQGDADEVVPAAKVKEWAAAIEPRPELVVMPDTDHFFHGHLVDLRSILVNGISQLLEQADAGKN